MQTAMGKGFTKVNGNDWAQLCQKMSKSIDQGLSTAMPETIKELLYQEIILGYRIDIEKFIADPGILQLCFDDILGDSGSGVVQRHIIEAIGRSFDLEFSSDDLNLAQAINELQLKLEFQ
jgi:hypothetical protein